MGLQMDEITPIGLVQDLLADPKKWSAKIEGRAGTGKTTSLVDIAEYLDQQEVVYAITAYTHAAVKVLKSKLPTNTPIFTLHKFLKKRPTINGEASKITHLTVSRSFGTPEPVRLLIVDEYSMISDRDYMDIGTHQDPEGEGVPLFKVLYVGDPYQLPSIDTASDIRVDSELLLTTIHRQAEGSTLLSTLSDIVDSIDSGHDISIVESDSIICVEDLVDTYNKCHTSDKLLLAYTNANVQDLNARIQGRDLPIEGDIVYDNIRKIEAKVVKFHGATPPPIILQDALNNGNKIIYGDKYNTIGSIAQLGICYVTLEALGDTSDNTIECGDTYSVPYIFGVFNYKDMREKLGKEAVESNNSISSSTNTTNVAKWCKEHKTDKRALRRAMAWRDFLTFDGNVTSLEFIHARTVHKAQGLTLEAVMVDVRDIATCKDTTLIKKLLYVAFSRTREKVYINYRL